MTVEALDAGSSSSSSPASGGDSVPGVTGARASSDDDTEAASSSADDVEIFFRGLCSSSSSCFLASSLPFFAIGGATSRMTASVFRLSRSSNLRLYLQKEREREKKLVLQNLQDGGTVIISCLLLKISM